MVIRRIIATVMTEIHLSTGEHVANHRATEVACSNGNGNVFVTSNAGSARTIKSPK